MLLTIRQALLKAKRHHKKVWAAYLIPTEIEILAADGAAMDPRDVQHALAGKAKGFGMGRWVYFTPTAEQLTFLTTCHPKD